MEIVHSNPIISQIRVGHCGPRRMSAILEVTQPVSGRAISAMVEISRTVLEIHNKFNCLSEPLKMGPSILVKMSDTRTLALRLGKRMRLAGARRDLVEERTGLQD